MEVGEGARRGKLTLKAKCMVGLGRCTGKMWRFKGSKVDGEVVVWGY